MSAGGRIIDGLRKTAQDRLENDLNRRPRVVVVGGGFSGAVLAHQLARRAPGVFRIVVVEPRERLGGGVAYSTSDPAHRINVPATRMSFVSSDPCHFDRWLKSSGELDRDPAALTPDGRAFPTRAAFGRYAAETIEPYLLNGEIEHRCTSAISIAARGDGFAVELADGDMLDADFVAFAASHPSPCPPAALEGLVGDPRLVVDTQDRAALDKIPGDARILIVGTGLTMADIAASLERRGHGGPITAVSRRGLLSRGHCCTPGEFGAFSQEPSRTALHLLRRIRRTVAAANAAALPWQHALDGVRNQGRAIWTALPEAERRKIVRRLRPFWDVHRFRVAPQVEVAIARLKEDGRLSLLVGEPVAARSLTEGLEIDFKLRGGLRETRVFDAVTLATGPAHRKLCETSALVSGLKDRGLISLDSVGLGFAVAQDSVALGPDGRRSEGLWIVGPLARGAFGELMGLPEVARHAELVAGEIVKRAASVAARPQALELA